MKPISSKEARLVLQAGAGDRDALEILLSGLQSRLFSYVSGIVGRTAADDILQDAFLQICRNLKWLRDPELFVPWAYRIASRAAFKHLKREHRYRAADDDTFVLDELAAEPESPRQLFSDLPEMLDKVSPASRAVLTLHYLHELTIQEVAAVLDIEVGTAKSRLAYGLACLREVVKPKNKL